MWLILWPSLFFLWTYLQRLWQKRQSEGDVWPLRSCVGSAHAQSRCHGVFKDVLHFNATVKPEELQYARQWLILSGSFESLMSSSEHKHNWTWNHTCTLQGISRTSSPLNSLEPLLSVSHAVIWNSALSAPVSTQPAIKHACWTSWCAHHSAGPAGTLAFWRWFLVCMSWPLAFFIFLQFSR